MTPANAVARSCAVPAIGGIGSGSRGRACYLIEGDGALLDLLLRLHWIDDERQLSDRRAVEAAISAMLAASART
jgi:hypothetical protein